MGEDNLAPLIFFGMLVLVALVVVFVFTDNVATLERIVLPLVTFGAGFLVGKATKSKK